MNTKNLIQSGNINLGVEFGSTRIKAVLTSKGGKVIAQSDYTWENKLVDGIWSYDLDEVWLGLQTCYAQLNEKIFAEYGEKLTKIGAMGFSGMMHGYLAFDKHDNLLVPFRTWRNTMTGRAVEILSRELKFNIPQRWTCAHLYSAILNKEEHVGQIDFVTTLAGYVHYKLTGNKVVGIGEASGIFPIDENTLDYNEEIAVKFNDLTAKEGFGKTVKQVFPKVLTAGQCGGVLTKEGSLLIDPTGTLRADSVICPPEGDAGTGMVATNSVLPKTGNVSAGTSIFAMLVLEKSLSDYYEEVDMVTTPSGAPVAMIHCNTCTSDIDAWVKMQLEFAKEFNPDVTKDDIYRSFYNAAVKGDYDCGGLCSVNYYAGEPVVGVENGYPMQLRKPGDKLTFPNFARNLVYSSFACVKLGMDLLRDKEAVKAEKLLGHGGLFKAEGVAQQMMASGFDIPVQTMSTAGEGGAWGMAILAEYMREKAEGQSLSAYLKKEIFADSEQSIKYPYAKETEGFNKFIESYKTLIELEKQL